MRELFVQFALFFAFSCFLFAESLQPVDKFLDSGGWWDGIYIYDDSLIVEEQVHCKEVDELGGQPPVTIAIDQEAKGWAKKNLPENPRYYLSTIPKRGLAQDVLMKQRQDKLKKRLDKLRVAIIAAYSQ